MNNQNTKELHRSHKKAKIVQFSNVCSYNYTWAEDFFQHQSSNFAFPFWKVSNPDIRDNITKALCATSIQETLIGDMLDLGKTKHEKFVLNIPHQICRHAQPAFEQYLQG